MTPPSEIRIVCFDLGGVLVRICRTWEQGCHAAGLDVRGGSTGEGAVAARRELMRRFATGEISFDEWAVALSAVQSGLYTPDELKRIHDAWTLDEYDGVLELVDALHAASVPTACLSNTNHPHWVRLVHHDGAEPLSGVPEYPSVHRLRHHFASHLMGLEKPDPAIYRAFEAASGFAAEQILFFDDLTENVAGARALGWNAERIDPATETVPQLREVLVKYGVLA